MHQESHSLNEGELRRQDGEQLSNNGNGHAWDYEADYVKMREEGCLGWGRSEAKNRLAGWMELFEVLENSGCISASRRDLLELGCGNGMVTIEAAKRDYRIHGIDISNTAINWANARLAITNQRGYFRQGDVCSMPFYTQDSFDIVVDGNCLHCIIGDERRKKCLAEVHRILRPDGRFLVSTMCGDTWVESSNSRFDRAHNVVLFNDIPWRTLKACDEIAAELIGAGFEILKTIVRERGPIYHLTILASLNQIQG